MAPVRRAYVYTDPNGALVNCRQFVETLAQELLVRLGRPSQRQLATDIAASSIANSVATS
jgi:hypothetical protein